MCEWFGIDNWQVCWLFTNLLPLLSNKQWFPFSIMRRNQWIWLKLSISNDITISCFRFLHVIFCQWSDSVTALGYWQKVVSSFYLQNELMDLDEISYMLLSILSWHFSSTIFDSYSPCLLTKKCFLFNTTRTILMNLDETSYINGIFVNVPWRGIMQCLQWFY